MRTRFTAIAGIVTSIMLLPTGLASANSMPDVNRMHSLVFQTSLSSFIDITRHQSPSDRAFDWSSDLCSAPMVGSTGRTFDFRSSCQRHDFAYRNFRKADLVLRCPTPSSGRLCTSQWLPSGRWWNSTIRHRIDRQFLSDMTAHCWSRPTSERIPCLAWAQIFYRTVRIAGGP